MVSRALILTTTAALLGGCLHFADEVEAEGGTSTGVRFDRIEVAGNCRGNRGVTYLWTIPLEGERMILPADVLRGGAAMATAYTDASIFFEDPKSPFEDAMGKNALATPLEGGGDTPSLVPLDLSAIDVDWVPTGGSDVPSSDRLVVLVVDNSGSLEQTDPSKTRAVFLKKVMRLLPADVRVALVVYDGTGARLAVGPSTSRDDIELELDLKLDPVGGGGLADGLQLALDEVIALNGALKPSILLFTDGNEGLRDDSVADLDDVLAALARRPGGVPIVLAHLLSEMEPREPEYDTVACESGGSAIVIPSAAALDSATRAVDGRDVFSPAVAGRLLGGWRVEIGYDDSGLKNGGRWLVRTSMSVTIDQKTSVKLLDEEEGDARLLVRGEPL